MPKAAVCAELDPLDPQLLEGGGVTKDTYSMSDSQMMNADQQHRFVRAQMQAMFPHMDDEMMAQAFQMHQNMMRAPQVGSPA